MVLWQLEIPASVKLHEGFYLYYESFEFCEEIQRQ
jgi:hypothetical protein